ncbi:MAG TPA: ABC transporter permease [Desulfarculaceae bacterium]|nr:ABC transporter permease [Desulfarculaceae bacterium]
MFKVMLIKEFKLVWRDKHALVALFIMPAIFILIMSIALKDTFNSDRSLVNYAVVDLDKTGQSLELMSFLESDKGLHCYSMVLANPAERRRALREELDFVVEIPAGFTERLLRADAERPLVPLIIYAASDIKREMLKLFKSRLAGGVLRLRLTDMKLTLSPLLPESDLEKAAAKFANLEFDAAEIARVQFNDLAVGQKPTSTQQSVPSWIVFGMFFVIIPLSTIFINEQRQNTLLRMSSMNVSTPLLFAGKIVPYMLINQIQVWLMIAVGMFVVPLFGADVLTLGKSLGGLFMVSFGLSLSAVGTAILIAVSVKTVEQATTIGGIINILLGAVGGIMVPKFFMPEVMQRLAEISPMSWGLDGFLDIFLRGLGPESVLGESLKLVALGAFLLFVAGIVFNRKMRLNV